MKTERNGLGDKRWGRRRLRDGGGYGGYGGFGDYVRRFLPLVVMGAVLVIAGVGGEAWGATYDVEYNPSNSTNYPADAFNERGNTTTPGSITLNPSIPAPGDVVRDSSAFAIINGVLHVATATWTYNHTSTTGGGDYVYTATRTGTVWAPLSPWSSSIVINLTDDDNGTFNSIPHGAVAISTTVNLTGNDNTLNLSGNNNGTGGVINGTFNLGTGSNTLRVGYHEGTGYSNSHTNGPEAGGTISDTGTVNVGYGYIGIYAGATVTGTINAATVNNATTVYQYDGTVNGTYNAGAGGIFIAGASSAYDMSGGTITNSAHVEMTGGNSTFRLHNDVLSANAPPSQLPSPPIVTPPTTHGVIDGDAVITMSGGGNTFNQYGDDTTHHGHLTGNATVNLQGGNNTYNLYEQGVIDQQAAVNMSGGKNIFNQYGSSSINGVDANSDTTKITLDANGDNNKYSQYGASTINGTTIVTLENADQNEYLLYDTASINESTDINIDGSSNIFNQYGDGYGTAAQSSKITGNTNVSISGNTNKYSLHDAASIEDQTIITITGNSNTFDQYDYSAIIEDTDITITGYGGPTNMYWQHGNSTINGTTTTVTLKGGNSLYRLYDNARIDGNSVISLIDGDNNRFHQYHNTAIIGTSVINLNEPGSNGNYFLIDDYDDASGSYSPASISSTGAGGNVINLNGSGSHLNVFTQLHGRVSTATNAGNTNPNGANINLNGAQSHQNIFELDGDLSFNDYRVFIGSNDTVTPGNNTSTQGIYHQAGGRKNGNITITGSQNLFWLNDNANYYAETAINSGSGTNSGDNLVVIDFANGGAGYHSRPGEMAVADSDTIDPAHPGFADSATLNLGGTTSGKNNLFLANGDVYGTITAGGGTSDSYVYIGFTQEKNGNTYSWYKNDSAGYNPTDLNGGLIDNNPDADAGPEIAPTAGYFNLASDVADTDHLNVKRIVGGGGELHAQVTAGNLYNLKGNTGSDTNIANYPAPGQTFPFMLPSGYPAGDYNYSPVYTTASAPGSVPAAYDALHYTADYSNDGDYLAYSILNQDAVNVGAYVDNKGTADDPNDDTFNLSPTRVAIGAIKDAGLDNDYESIDLSSNTELIPNRQDDHNLAYYNDPSNYGPHSYGDFHDDHQAQITAGMVNVYASSKLTIHPNFNEMGQTAAPAGTQNIIGNLNIIGRPAAPADCNECGYTPYDPSAWAVVTIDRTTINTVTAGATITHNPYIDPSNPKHGDTLTLYGGYAANVIVGTNGILQGFGEITSATNHSPRRPNIVGDVAVLAGGTIRPYDGNNGDQPVYDYANKTSHTIPGDGIFVVHGNALTGNPGYTPDFEANVNKLKGLIMQVDGTTQFEHSSRLSTRLFAQVDAGAPTIAIVSDGTDTDASQAGLPNPVHTPATVTANVQRYWGDSLESTALVFDEIAYSSIYLANGLNNPYTAAQLLAGTANGQTIPGKFYGQIGDTAVWTGVSQANKVQYDPVFGFVNEIKSKLEYEIFKGNPGDQSGEQTYYYQVAYATGGATIAALAGMPDANHLFNRDIVFSDMLGNWSFEMQDGEKGVVLRYRMLAAHPQDGGIARDIPERNAREAAKKLDEIRYPFLTAHNIADPTLDHSVFAPDPSLDGGYGTPYDLGKRAGLENSEIYNGNAYDQAGFNGDIKQYYWLANEARPGVFNLPLVNGVYQNYWVEDIENYFRALQLEAVSAATINRAVRLITAETYASQTNSDLSLMSQFIAGRERSAVSGLFQVERPADAEARRAQDPFLHPLDEDLPTEFVPNPLRVWASSFGGTFNQRRRGDEYGYRTQHYGLQLGLVKEIGDLYLGLTGAYTRSHNRWSELQTHNKSNNFMGEALIGLRRGLGFLELHANAGYMDHQMRRDLTLGESLNGDAYDQLLDCDPADNYYNGVYSVQQTGDYANRILGGGLRLGYQKTFLDKWLFLPTIGINFMDVRNPRGFTEDGPESAAFRLVFGKGGISRTTLRVPLMLRLSRGIAWNRGGPWIFTPEVRFGVTANLLDRGGRADYLWRGNPIRDRWIKAWGIEEDRLSCQAGVTLELSKRGRFFTALNYDYYFQKGSGNHGYSFQAGLNF